MKIIPVALSLVAAAVCMWVAGAEEGWAHYLLAGSAVVWGMNAGLNLGNIIWDGWR